jgi:hypothetical protein
MDMHANFPWGQSSCHYSELFLITFESSQFFSNFFFEFSTGES